MTKTNKQMKIGHLQYRYFARLSVDILKNLRKIAKNFVFQMQQGELPINFKEMNSPGKTLRND